MTIAKNKGLKVEARLQKKKKSDVYFIATRIHDGPVEIKYFRKDGGGIVNSEEVKKEKTKAGVRLFVEAVA